MITRTKQNWSVGQTVKVGFLQLKVMSVRAVRDGLPDIYTLESLNGKKKYEFIPHNGLTRINWMDSDLKVFDVEVKTQFGRRNEQWGFFNSYYARNKRDAIRQAKYENWNKGCFDGRTHGLIWWRAIEK